MPLASSSSDLMELLEAVSLPGSWHVSLWCNIEVASVRHVLPSDFDSVCIHSTGHFSPFTGHSEGLRVHAGLAERVGGFEAEAEWSHVLRCAYDYTSKIAMPCSFDTVSRSSCHLHQWNPRAAWESSSGSRLPGSSCIALACRFWMRLRVQWTQRLRQFFTGHCSTTQRALSR